MLVVVYPTARLPDGRLRKARLFGRLVAVQDDREEQGGSMPIKLSQGEMPDAIREAGPEVQAEYRRRCEEITAKLRQRLDSDPGFAEGLRTDPATALDEAGLRQELVAVAQLATPEVSGHMFDTVDCSFGGGSVDIDQSIGAYGGFFGDATATGSVDIYCE
jgi:hypothetical protein